MLRPKRSIKSLFALLALNNYIQNFTSMPNQDFESRDFSYFETMTSRDQDSRSRLEVQVRGETETRLSKMCLETVSRSETGLENSITSKKKYLRCFAVLKVKKRCDISMLNFTINLGSFSSCSKYV